MPLYKVEAISQFRMVYFIEAQEAIHAEDEVCMRDAYTEEDPRYFDEAAQQHIGETIVCTDEVTYEDFTRWLQNNEKIASHWMKDKLIHKAIYDDEMPVQFAESDEEATSRLVMTGMVSQLAGGKAPHVS